MTKHGLSKRQIELIKETLRPFAEKINTVALFGSRAQGTYRDNSDIDMVLYGSLIEEDIKRIHSLFDESSLSLRVDVNAYHLVNYLPLKQHIDKVSYTLLEQNDLK